MMAIAPCLSGGGGDAAAQEAAVRRRRVVDVQFRRLDARTAMMMTVHDRIEDAARQEGPFDGIGGLTILEQLLDVAGERIEVARARRLWQMEHARDRFRLAL